MTPTSHGMPSTPSSVRPRALRVSIVIPVYNEKPTLSLLLERVFAAALPHGCEREVIVVDDGSTDGTGDDLDRYVASDFSRISVASGFSRTSEHSMVIHHSTKNLGKGSALREGISRATGDIVLVQDGDLEYDPKDYAALLQPIVDGRADVVYGSRFRSSVRGMKLANYVANRILTLAANLLYRANITDEATAYKAFRATLLKSLVLECRRFEFCPEVTAKVRRLGVKIHEVPISYQPRSIEEGKKIRAWDGLQALWTLARFRAVPTRTFLRQDLLAKTNTSAQAVQ